jgi:hypothetical protein
MRLRRNGSRVWPVAVGGLLFAALVLAGESTALAQSNLRLLLATGWGVPGYSGYAFGRLSHLTMNGAREIVFLSTLRGAKRDLRAVVRSSGVSFSVVAFEGLRSPVAKATYTSFSAPAVNSSGVIAFTAGLKDDVPSSAVIRVEESNAAGVAVSGSLPPGNPDATFAEFSAPVVGSAGNVLFGARVEGKRPSSGLYLWTAEGLQVVPLPPEFPLGPADLLVPMFFSQDEAVFVARGPSREVVTDQFFRAIATRNFQALQPPPALSDEVEVLPARPSEPPVQMLLVLMQGQKVQTATLQGDPAQPVMSKLPPGTLSLPLGQVQGQTTGLRGNIIFASAPLEQETDLALYCYCDGQINRLTSPEGFLPITQFSQGRPISSLAGDAQHTVAFIAPNDVSGDSDAIYVVSVP